MFFHLFSYEQQIEVAKRTVKLMRPVEGSLLVGWQVGSSDTGALRSEDGGTLLYRHDGESWAGLWREVGEQTGVKFVVESWMDDAPRLLAGDEKSDEAWLKDSRRLKFSVRRV
jgi:hypothetical protein